MVCSNCTYQLKITLFLLRFINWEDGEGSAGGAAENSLASVSFHREGGRQELPPDHPIVNAVAGYRPGAGCTHGR
jgi:hypothetical protein